MCTGGDHTFFYSSRCADDTPPVGMSCMCGGVRYPNNETFAEIVMLERMLALTPRTA